MNQIWLVSFQALRQLNESKNQAQIELISQILYDFCFVLFLWLRNSYRLLFSGRETNEKQSENDVEQILLFREKVKWLILIYPEDKSTKFT